MHLTSMENFLKSSGVDKLITSEHVEVLMGPVAFRTVKELLTKNPTIPLWRILPDLVII